MDGSAEAEAMLTVLYQEHRPAIDAYCRRRGVPSEAVADVLSDVFLTAWRRVADIPPDAELPWLYGVARRIVLNHQRSGRRRMRLSAVLASQPPPQSPDTETQVVRRAEERILLAALASLRPDDQEIIRLRAWEELSSVEIGIVLGISPPAVDMRLTRAKRRLGRALSAAGYFEAVSPPRTVRNGGTS
jgi:RNA polymerase sigma-70 factor (ECF subfamily)